MITQEGKESKNKQTESSPEQLPLSENLVI